MLTKEEFTSLSQHLQSVAHLIPYQWGRMPSRDIDRRLPKIFTYQTYGELQEAIQRNVGRGILSDNDHENDYYRHRWFAYKCSEVDEYMFVSLLTPDDGATPLNKFNLELKGVVMYKPNKDKPKLFFENPLALIDTLYKEQRKSYYYSRRLENRLFIVYYSASSLSREPILRSDFSTKSKIFEEYKKMILNSGHEIYDYMNGRKSDVIFFMEDLQGTLLYGIGSENLKGELIIHG